jgi:hypothetical protein
MIETQISIPETKLQSNAVGGGEGAIFKDSLTALRNEVPADIFKETVANKTENESVKKSGDAGNETVERIPTRNEALEGQCHPDTGVPFKAKEVENGQGETVEGVFPEFDKDFIAQLPEELLQESDSVQFKECNEQLKEWVESHHEEAGDLFDREQLDDIANGHTPEGYTWHHSENIGEIELVDTEIHAKTGHTGGKVIWGGGCENR